MHDIDFVGTGSHETMRRTDEVIFLPHRRRPETKICYSGSLLNQRGLGHMWWVLVVSLVLGYPIVEMAEEWRLRRWARKDLAEMRKHTASGHRWDVTRGQWVG
jgi:hypothetical protein